MEPTNIELVDPKKENWVLKKPVTTTDVVEGMTNNLHPDGLYSTTIFGRMGTPERKTTEAYINLKLEVFPPVVFKVLKSLKSLYSGIMQGVTYALWDETQKDFIKSNILEGDTGFSFFLKHFDQIVFKRNNSPSRGANIYFLEKYRDSFLTSKYIIFPD